MGKLVLLLADGTTQDVPLTSERLVIGRRADNDVCLPHPAVSGEHASVVTILADSFLEDLGSTNGTLVNGKAIVKHFLRDYDQIDIGRQRLVFVSDDNMHVDPLPPDIARGQLLGLDQRVEPARPLPFVAVPPTGNVRRDAVNTPAMVHPDLDDDAALEPPPAPRREAPSRREAPPAPRRETPAAQSPFIDHRPPATRREADQRLAAWAAEWAAPTGRTNAGPVDTADSSDPSDTPDAPEDADAFAMPAISNTRRASPTSVDATQVVAPKAATIAEPVAPTVPNPMVRVLSGPNQGRAVQFKKDELSVGRIGVQVAVVRRVGTGFRLVPIEGPQPPRINGVAVAPDGAVLHPGDTFEVAGVRLELSVTG
ncbi:MAG: FHA domain-containing protein [Betaproteobacteria bacterium]